MVEANKVVLDVILQSCILDKGRTHGWDDKTDIWSNGVGRGFQTVITPDGMEDIQPVAVSSKHMGGLESVETIGVVIIRIVVIVMDVYIVGKDGCYS